MRAKLAAGALAAVTFAAALPAVAASAAVQPRSAYVRSSVDDARRPQRLSFTDRAGRKTLVVRVCGTKTEIEYTGGNLMPSFASDDGRWVIVDSLTRGNPNPQTWLVYRPAGRVIGLADFPAVFGVPAPAVAEDYSFTDSSIPQLHYITARPRAAVRLSLPKTPRRLPARTCIPDA